MRIIAFSIVLMIAGMNLKFNYTKLYTIAYASLPLIIEATSAMILGIVITDLNFEFSFLMGLCLSAVSPSIVITKLIMLQKKGFGIRKNIPKIIYSSAILQLMI